MQNLPHPPTTGSVGILVFGDNHFILRGPKPDRTEATALMRHWSIIRIGTVSDAPDGRWRISTREFREHLEWAVVVPGDGRRNPAVSQLLSELEARGITIDDYSA